MSVSVTTKNINKQRGLTAGILVSVDVKHHVYLTRAMLTALSSEEERSCRDGEYTRRSSDRKSGYLIQRQACYKNPTKVTPSAGAVRESRWTSWAVRPNEPSGFRGRKELLNRASALVTTCP